MPTTAIHIPSPGRAPKPRVYTLPIVRPAPPRPTGGAARTS